MDKYLSAYGDGLTDWVIGNIEWSLVNCRYKVFCNDSDRRSNVVRLKQRHIPPLTPLLCFLLLVVFIISYFYGFTERLPMRYAMSYISFPSYLK